jgi:hypothetical protein
MADNFSGTGTLSGSANIELVASGPYSWTPQFTLSQYMQVGYTPEYGTTAQIEFPQPVTQPGWAQIVGTTTTFTISGITGPYAALNGKTITSPVNESNLLNFSGFGVEFTNTWSGLSLPQFIGFDEGGINNVLPGFTLSWN